MEIVWWIRKQDISQVPNLSVIWINNTLMTLIKSTKNTY